MDDLQAKEIVGATVSGITGIITDAAVIREYIRRGVALGYVTRRDALDTVFAFQQSGQWQHPLVDYWRWFTSAPTLFAYDDDGDVVELP